MNRLVMRCISLLLCVILLMPALFSCGDEEGALPTPDTDADHQPNDTTPPDGGQTEEEDETVAPEQSFPSLTVRDELSVSPIAMRSYYPDYNVMLQRLLDLKAAVKSGVLSDEAAVRSELISSLRMAERLGVYYDYFDHTSYTDGETTYGATASTYPIGGGKNYEKVKRYHCVVGTDDDLHAYSKRLDAGDILYITNDASIDLSDFLLAGDTDGYRGAKVDFSWKVNNGATWISDRGVGDHEGAILKMTSPTSCAIIVGKNAKLSGLVIQGPDRGEDRWNYDQNLSIAIVVSGDGAVIENCEISGFYRAGIYVKNAKNVVIKNNYLHDIQGENSGYAVLAENAKVEMYGNLFSNVTTALAAVGENTTVDFHDNMDAGNITKSYLLLSSSSKKDEEYASLDRGVSSVSVRNNTLLSRVDLLDLRGLPEVLVIENNLFGYPEAAYEQTAFTMDGMDGSIFEKRIQMRSNVFDVQSPLVLSKTANASPENDDPLLGCYSVLVSDALKPFEIDEKKAVSVTYQSHAKLPVLASSYYTESNDFGYSLLEALLASNVFSGESFSKNLIDAISAIGGYSNYIRFEEEDLISVVVDGQRYGAYSDTDPIGGGIGYSQIVTTGDYIVRTEEELRLALEQAKAGQVVFIPSGIYINVSDVSQNTVRTLTVPAGVTLASDRGRLLEDGSYSTGAIIASSVFGASVPIAIGGEGARLTGFVLRGPDPASHERHHSRAFADTSNKLMTNYYWKIPNITGIVCNYDHVEIDNIELSGFNTNGIRITNKESPLRDVKVHHVFLHHCQIKGLGYGVRFDYGYAEVTYNVFNYNRHSIAGGGDGESGYLAENNIEMGNSLDHYFDMHGGADRGDGTTIAGKTIEMRNNSFLGSWRPFVLRGIPTDHQDFSYNVAASNDIESTYYLLYYDGWPLNNVTVGKNIWGIQNGNRNPKDGI